MKHQGKFLFTQITKVGEQNYGTHMFFNLFQIFLFDLFNIARSNITPFCGNGVDIPFSLQLIICTLGGYDTNTKIFCKITYRRKRFSNLKLA